jgi:hypothetical protein
VVNGERKSSGLEQYRQERELRTIPGVPLKRLARGTLNAGRRKRKLALTVRHANNKPTTEGVKVMYLDKDCKKHDGAHAKIKDKLLTDSNSDMDENNCNDSDSGPGVGNNNSTTETGGIINEGSSNVVCLLCTTQIEFNGCCLMKISLHIIYSTTPWDLTT